MPAKRKYKDSVFTSLFKDKKRLLELYNAIEGTSYKNPNLITINKGHNPKLEQKSKNLAGYSTFVAKVREFQSIGNPLKQAIEKAVRHCIDKGILRDYLRQHSSEVVNMFNVEFNLKDAIAVAREEGREKGIEEGIEKGEARGEKKGIKKLLALWEKGVPLAEAKRRLGVNRKFAIKSI